MKKTEKIFHLIEKEVWEQLPKSTPYTPPSLADQGFIHFSTSEQLPTTLQRYYPDDVDMVALEIEVKDIPENLLKWEESHPGEFFPHLYGALDLALVKEIHNPRA
jgi:uncharacterized protein (DUF952 family)